MSTLSPCLNCGTPLVGKPRDKDDRAKAPKGFRFHGGHGLCETCAQRLRRNGTPKPPEIRTIPKDCTVLDGHCTCRWCTLAANDEGSDLDLGGTWVRRGLVRVWTPTPKRRTPVA